MDQLKNELLCHYSNNNFTKCIQCMKEFQNRSTGTLYPLRTSDEISNKFLIENNELLCEAMNNILSCSSDWSKLMNRFVELVSRYRSLIILPIEVELNCIYNTLWWFTMKDVSSKYKSLYYNTILKTVSLCLAKVLKSCGEPTLGLDLCNHEAPVSSLVNLLQRTSHQLLHVNPLVCSQLCSVIVLTVLMLLKHLETKALADCSSFLQRTNDDMDVIRLHLQNHSSASSEEVLFKFGLTRVNSTASMKNCTELVNALSVISSIVASYNEEFESAIHCLNQIPGTKDSPFYFLNNCVKAYCYVHLGRHSEAKLSLTYANSTPQPPLCHAHHCLLLARVLSAEGDYQAALEQCEAALASSEGSHLISLAAHLAAQTAHELRLSNAQIHYLNMLIKSQKHISAREDDCSFQKFEECGLTLLFSRFSITLLEANYSLARQFYDSGYHIKALNSYKELLELMKSEYNSSLRGLPRKVQILQEAALAYVKANSLTGGEELCRQLIRDYVPSASIAVVEGKGYWDTALYHLEEDAVASILLSDILANKDNKKALDELNRCYNAVSESRDQAGEGETLTELCDWFLSRILLRKAKLSQSDDAAHYFRRALLHKPGDKEVIYHYKQWALWHPDHQSFDPGDLAVKFPSNEVKNLALKHILSCSVSEEEWAALFDHRSSCNVLDTLFDDDDD